jgi:DNA polymerase III psi subunit
MGEQLTTSAEALRLFFTEDIYLVNSNEKIVSEIPAEAKSAPVTETTVPVVETVKPVAAPVTVVAEPAAEVVRVPVTGPVVFKYLGKNLKNILILVHDDQNDVSTDKGKELLRNIVKALQLTANDFALLNYAAYRSSGFDEFKSFFKCNLVLSFGVTPLHLGIDPQPVNEIIIRDAAQLIFSANLDQLADDQAGKKALWGSLKKLSI